MVKYNNKKKSSNRAKNIPSKKGVRKPARKASSTKQKPTSTTSRSREHPAAECAAKYAIAAAEPFRPEGIGACVPVFPSRASQKCRSVIHGTFQIGTGGFGFVSVAPTVARDVFGAFATTASFAGTQVIADDTQFFPVGGPQTVKPMHFAGLCYTADELKNGSGSGNGEPNVSGRIISCGVRIRYVGTEDKKSGSMGGYVDANHNNLNKEYEYDLRSRDACISVPCTRDWVSTQCVAVDTGEMAYPPWNPGNDPDAQAIRLIYPYSNAESLSNWTNDLQIGGTPMVLFATGEPKSNYEFEVVVHVEYTGNLTQQKGTSNVANNAMALAVVNAVQGTCKKRVNEKSAAREIYLDVMNNPDFQGARSFLKSRMALWSAKAGAAVTGAAFSYALGLSRYPH